VPRFERGGGRGAPVSEAVSLKPAFQAMKIARCCAELGLGLGFFFSGIRGVIEFVPNVLCQTCLCGGLFFSSFCLRLMVKLLTAPTVQGRFGGVALRVLAPLIREGFFLSASLRVLVLVNLFLTAF
jgi:hypothetical protein